MLCFCVRLTDLYFTLLGYIRNDTVHNIKYNVKFNRQRRKPRVSRFTKYSWVNTVVRLRFIKYPISKEKKESFLSFIIYDVELWLKLFSLSLSLFLFSSFYSFWFIDFLFSIFDFLILYFFVTISDSVFHKTQSQYRTTNSKILQNRFYTALTRTTATALNNNPTIHSTNTVSSK
mgnify:CR=1 FL=1